MHFLLVSLFLPLAAVLEPHNDPVPRTPTAAEQLDGLTLLTWRLRSLSLLRQGNPQEAAEILHSLVGDDAHRHWSRTILAREACELGPLPGDLQFPLRLTQIPAPTSSPPARLEDLEEWVLQRFPYLDPARVLQCARAARSHGRHADAVDWYNLAFPITPITDPAFFSLAYGVVSLLRSRDGHADASQLLEDITGRPWRGEEDFEWLEGKLSMVTGYLPRSSLRILCAELLDACPTGRLHMALRYRLLESGFEEGLGSTAQWLTSLESLLTWCDHPLDEAALAHRIAMRRLHQDLQDPEGIEALRQAYRRAPPSHLAQQITGELLSRVARLPQTDAEITAILQQPFEQPRFVWEPLLSAVDLAIDLLLANGRHELLRDISKRMEEVVEDDPFRARLLQMLASIEPDPDTARQLYQQCLRVETFGQNASFPPQLHALFALAHLAQDRKNYRASAEYLGRALALSPPPGPYRPEVFADHAELLRLSLLAGEPVDRIIELFFLLLDGGRAVSGTQEEEVLELLVPVFSRTTDRRALLEELQERYEALPAADLADAERAFLERMRCRIPGFAGA
jgi:tetratricopeptide (TPR) repeat protein